MIWLLYFNRLDRETKGKPLIRFFRIELRKCERLIKEEIAGKNNETERAGERRSYKVCIRSRNY